MSTYSTAVRRGIQVLFALLLGFSVVTPALAAFPPAEVEEEHRQSLEYVTPHTEWAKPYARGKVRMLFISETVSAMFVPLNWAAPSVVVRLVFA